jgi:hypothetical protein
MKAEKPGDTPTPASQEPAADYTIIKPKPAKHPESAPEQRGPRKTPPVPKGQIRLYINAGAEMGVGQEDVVSAIQGHTGLSRAAVGHVDVRERYLFVDVSADHGSAIISKLNRGEIKGRKVKVKVA